MEAIPRENHPFHTFFPDRMDALNNMAMPLDSKKKTSKQERKKMFRDVVIVSSLVAIIRAL